MSPGEIEARARSRFGEPNRRLSTRVELRYGRKGSLAVQLVGSKAGLWYDHEAVRGGSLLSRDERPDDHRDLTASQRRQIRDDEQRRHRVADVLERCIDPDGTPVVAYLRRRGITRDLPHSIRFCRRPYGMAALAQDGGGGVRAVQITYLTDDGRKARRPDGVQKRTLAACENWVAIAAVRFPGSRGVVLCEGVETALSVWQATGRTVWACLGPAGIGRIFVPGTGAITIARDGDAPDSKADLFYQRILDERVKRRKILVAQPPVGQDYNDILQMPDGEEMIRESIRRARPWPT